MAADYIVIDIAAAGGIAQADIVEATREAIGRLYAEQRDEVWPIRSRFPNGDIDPDIENATFYYWDPRLNVAGDKAAFGPPDDQSSTDLQAYCLGKTVETTYGEVELPSAVTSLEENWFAS